MRPGPINPGIKKSWMYKLSEKYMVSMVKTIHYRIIIKTLPLPQC